MLSAFLFFLVARSSAYFLITQPTQGSQWLNGSHNPVSWRKGVDDGIHHFDVQLMRVQGGGIMLIAKNVPSSPFSFALVIEDVPPGDDYVLAFVDSAHSIRYALSPRLTILPAFQSSTPTSPTPAAASSSAASSMTASLTLTASGAPDPTRGFATTVLAVVSKNTASKCCPALPSSAWTLVSLLFFVACWTRF